MAGPLQTFSIYFRDIWIDFKRCWDLSSIVWWWGFVYKVDVEQKKKKSDYRFKEIEEVQEILCFPYVHVKWERGKICEKEQDHQQREFS